MRDMGTNHSHNKQSRTYVLRKQEVFKDRFKFQVSGFRERPQRQFRGKDLGNCSLSRLYHLT
jgi:hypothetical protein